MRHRASISTAVMAAAVGLAAAACTGNGDAAATPGTPVTASLTTAPTTTVPRPTTTAATTTSTSTTTTSTTTTVAPTTVAPTTTVPPTTAAPAPALIAPATPVAPARSGQSGDNVAALQERLLALGFWVNGIDHRYGFVTAQGVMAFQKHFGLKADGIAGKDTTALMNQPLPRVTGRATAGDLMEVDKAKQVLYVIRGGQTIWAFNTSTGSGKDYTEFSEKNQRPISGSSITPEGNFKVNREHADGWWNGDLGDLYRPKYFRGGVAVHGSNKIPNYPASHGCVRVSTSAMDFIWAQNFMPLRSAVWVHAG